MQMKVNLYTKEVQNWINEIQKNRGINPQKTLEYCDKLENYGRKISEDALIGFACFSKGETYYLMNDMRNFYSQMLACMAPMERIGEWGYLVMANNMLGIMSLNRGNAPFAMDYYMKALNYCHSYKLPDLEWIVHMNMGSLYLNIEEYQKALDHLEKGYHYIISHTERPDYVQNLMSAYLGIAKAYLHMDNLGAAEKYNNKIENECKQQLSRLDMLIVEIFQAQLKRALGAEKDFNAIVDHISVDMIKDIPIMDYFDDIYEYMKMLLSAGKFKEFSQVYSEIEILVKRTRIKNLVKKILTLKIEFLKQNHREDEYKNATIEYFELSEQMEKENRLMVTSMIGMRNSLNDLVAINKEVEQENIALQKKSETDSLTGLYNRSKLNIYGEDAFERAWKNKTSLAIEILDIDYFKQYNDNYGHQEGDEAIRQIAGAMKQLGKQDNIFCSRYGGDEFVIIYEGYSKEETLRLAQELKRMITQKRITHAYSKAENYLTISQGICWGIPKEQNRVWDYLHTADELLYHVKKIARNNIRIGGVGDAP